MKLLALLLVIQSLTLSVGEERQADVWRSHAPRWDAYMVEAGWGPVVANVAWKHGTTVPDCTTASVGLQKHVARAGPWNIKARAAAYFEERWTPAIGFWASVPIWGPAHIQTAAYVRGQQSPFRAELSAGLKLGER